MQNFTVVDLVGTTLATLAFTIFLVPAGYLIGWSSNVFGMRERSTAARLLISVPLSIATVPVVAVLLCRYLDYRITLTLFLLNAVTCLVMFAMRRPAQHFSNVGRTPWIFLAMVAAWFLLVQVSLADLQVGNRLYVSYVAYDHSVRVPFVGAAARMVPPHNPFYGLGNAPVLRYYYYWYVVCALPIRMFGLSAKACLNASVFWSGLGLASLIPLFLKYFLGETERLREKSVIGIALLAVTGLDILPYCAAVRVFHVFLGDTEWWNSNQVTSWMGSLLWVPHHVAALIACMTGLLVFSAIDEESSVRQRVWAVIICGVAFASAAGLSVYVAFTFAGFAVVWAFVQFFQKQVKAWLTLAAAAALSFILSWPYLLDLLSKGAGIGPGRDVSESFAFFSIRDFAPAVTLLNDWGIHSSVLLGLLQVPILLVVYVLEFGFFFLIMVHRWREDRRSAVPLSRQRRMAWFLFAVCLGMMSVLKSSSTGSNDLGFRGILVVQFVLLIWAAPIVFEALIQKDAKGQPNPIAPWLRGSIVLTLLVGVASTIFQLVVLRCYAPLADAGTITRSDSFLGGQGFAQRTFWLREGYGRLDRLTSSATVVQYNPVEEEVPMAHLYSTRQAAIGDEQCGSVFGGDSPRCQTAYPYIAALFNSPDLVRRWNLDAVCDAFQVDVLVANDSDPVWRDPSGWVWSRPALLANPSMRAISCGNRSISSPIQ